MSTASLRRLGREVVLRRCTQVERPGVSPCASAPPVLPGHDVGVDVDGIDRIGDGDRVAPAPRMSRMLPQSHLEPSETKISSAAMSTPRGA